MFKYENQLNWNNQYTLYNTKESNFSSKEVLGMAISNRLTGYLVTKSVISYLWNWKSSVLNNISLQLLFIFFRKCKLCAGIWTEFSK